MPASASEWIALLGVNVISGMLAGLLARRSGRVLIAVAILLILNPFVVYFAPPLIAGRDLAEHRAWVGLIVPKLFVLGLPLVLLPAAVTFVARQYVFRKEES